MKPVAHAYLRAKIRCDDHGCTPHTHTHTLSLPPSLSRTPFPVRSVLGNNDTLTEMYACMYVCMYVCVLHRVCVCVCCIVCPSAACAKRPICMPKETYLYVKIDLPFAALRARA